MAASTLLVAAVVAATAVTRPAAGESPTGTHITHVSVEHRDGDEQRSMHWKQTARQQTPIVVERQRAREKPVFYVLDPRLDDIDDQAQRDRLERLVSDIATGVVRSLREGVPVGLVVGAAVVAPVRSFRRAPALLRPLAEVEAQPPGGEGPSTVEPGRRTRVSVRSISS